MKVGCAEGNGELFLGKDRVKILRIGKCEVTILPFEVVVSSLGEGVRLFTKYPGTETDDHVESREALRPSCLMPSEGLGGGEIYQILVVHDNDNGLVQGLKIVMPGFECVEDSL
jgi:hypothetical protein